LQKKVFQPFEQIYGSMTREYGGTGLGLSITNQLIEMQGGILLLESEKGKGSVFSFTIPIAPNHLDLVTEDSMNGLIKESKNFMEPFIPLDETVSFVKEPLELTGENIMIVDDDVVNLQVLRNFLELNHYRVIVAHNGEQALELLDEETIDLILLDVMMPNISGYDVCRIIRKRYQKYKLPIIMVTAKNQVQDLTLAFESGANDYLAKPFYKEELIARVQNQLQGKKSVERLKQVEHLEIEIQKRTLLEEELKISRRRLSRLLDTTDEAIISVNDVSEIFFLNHAAEVFLNYTAEELIGKSIDVLLKENPSKAGSYPTGEVNVMINRKGKPPIKTIAIIASLNLRNDKTYSMILETRLELKETNIPESKIEDMVSLKKNKIQALEAALARESNVLNDEDHISYYKNRSIDPRLDYIPDKLPDFEGIVEIRRGLVDLLSLTIKMWEQQTGRSKIELAEDSGLWRVYLDKGTYRTRTLDKYLSLRDLPKHPKWRNVLNTVQFALKQSLEDETSKQVVTLFSKLQTLLIRVVS